MTKIQELIKISEGKKIGFELTNYSSNDELAHTIDTQDIDIDMMDYMGKSVDVSMSILDDHVDDIFNSKYRDSLEMDHDIDRPYHRLLYNAKTRKAWYELYSPMDQSKVLRINVDLRYSKIMSHRITKPDDDSIILYED